MSVNLCAPVHWSDLKFMAKCPAKYRNNLEHPPEETAFMRSGSYVDHLVLGTKRPFAVWEGTRQGNAWKEFAAAHVGQTILTKAEADL